MTNVSRIEVRRMIKEGEKRADQMIECLSEHMKAFPKTMASYVAHGNLEALKESSEEWFTVLYVEDEDLNDKGDLKIDFISLVRLKKLKHKDPLKFITMVDTELDTKVLPINYLKEAYDKHEINKEKYIRDAEEYAAKHNTIIWDFYTLTFGVVAYLQADMIMIDYTQVNDFGICNMEFICPKLKRRVKVEINHEVATKDYDYAQSIINNEGEVTA